MQSRYKLALIGAILFLLSAAIYGPSFAGIGTRAKHLQTGSGPAQQATPDFSKNKWEIPADADQTRNPVSTSDESVAAGKELYFGRQANCVFCHGATGAGNEENLPKLRRKPADLSDAKRMPGLTDGEIYWKITKGIKGIMPSSDDPKLTATQRWDLVNFVRTLSVAK